ncbi:MAG: hypothetical protein HKO01_01675 [Flaviramulus sp.]|nr:hypothetical protein [Flaviramulus sp.]NNC49224.1 hypothetical protein [Flaviramulus sp.]
MKTIILILAISFTNICSAQFITGDDKLHIIAGAFISTATYTVVYSSTKNKKKAFWYSLSASLLAGISKELYDSSKENNKFDTGEVFASTTGGLIASTSFSLFVGKKKKENKKEVALVN